MRKLTEAPLQDVLFNDVIALDWAFRLSFINDLLRAISYLQSNTVLQCHGRLTSKCCYIDKRFVLKVGDYGLPSFYNTVTAIERREPADMLWSAPEILRSRNTNKASAEGDIFAFAIILSEVITRESPYYKSNASPEEIVRRVERSEHPPFRPTIDDPFVNQEILFVMQSCWADSPANRLKIPQVRNCLRLLSKSNGNENKSNIIDTLLERIEQHAQSLEDSVEEKTLALVEEKKKTDQLLYSILPKYSAVYSWPSEYRSTDCMYIADVCRSIAEQLKRGENVFPESYEGVTIYFGDIVDFTRLSSSSTPMEIVNLMNDLYYQFDQIIAGFDAYKVETVGDCYVIASGLPNRNGQKHASEMGRLALTLREAAKSFKIRHRPGTPIELRIGLNSGPCVAGVVGFQTPKYCL
ncbi:hypothetical protein RvY_18098 [Ramazzottius varieornatus]|uniref:guanylate cyclase n=1 Tax=Ramazzottius varieornatus TaxID=947166 RepID=A0A1D1W4J5_RAMVA|nr:hypothetical protein RvY_18098 [Ramazzottius varieornatus]